LVRGAAAGDGPARGAFGVRYAPVMGAYLAARWRGTPLCGDVDDAVQEVFLECLREGGVLARAQDDRSGGFRAFLFGVVRNVALRFEQRHAKHAAQSGLQNIDLGSVPGREDALSRVFDRALARSIMREAAERQTAQAADRGEDAARRVELLKLRFYEGLPIREIAALWGVDAGELHRQYAKARQEFHSSLREVVSEHLPASAAQLDAECAQLLGLLE
jgi:RNA polymerase sigma-70 factor (ECF subfamily)